MTNLCISLFIAVFIACLFLGNCEVFAFDTQNFGGIKVEVSDEEGNLICGAKVYVCEISECFETGKNGQTGNISVPILPDTRFLEICKKDFGELTLFVYKEGFCPTCVTGVIVRNKVTRLGPKVVLKAGGATEYIHVADQIDTSWLNKFCEKYAKK